MGLKDSLARGYSQSAALYDAVAGPLYLAGLYRLLPWVRVPPAPAILDVGCGTGINLLEAARLYSPCRYLAGVDISPGMVAVAAAKAAGLGVTADIRLGDAEHLPFPGEAFDLVICNSVFHWLPDRARAAREFARVLRPGGQLLLICAARPGFREWTGLLEGVLRRLLGGAAPPPFPTLPGPEEVGALLQAAGLHLLHLNHLIQPQVVRDPGGFIRLMATVAPNWTGDLPPAVQQQVESTVAGAMQALAPGGFPITWAAVECVAARSGGTRGRVGSHGHHHLSSIPGSC